MINISKKIFFSSVIIIFSLLLLISQGFSVRAFDVTIRENVQQHRISTLDYFMDSATKLGDGLFTGSIAISIPDSKLQNHAIKTQIIASVSTNLLKLLIGRQRPSVEKPDPLNFKPLNLNSSYHSMPSGHTSATFALAASIGETCEDYKFLSYSLAVLVGISRIYLDNHWTSDVLAGAAVGYLSAKFVSYHW